MVSASTTSANEPAKDLILVHRVLLTPMIKAQISGKIVSCSISITDTLINPSEDVDNGNDKYYEKKGDVGIAKHFFN